ncbi:hypothetical protein LOC71_05840 [Rhodopirellula sp. JC740]|uniref:Uncharacterized protein n=1 Tax=Rhodopirellula halodulae TaxID=2894198 RepID=A0ABS8NG07_9BACT|nr:hypothetical protein [Rhodopirellula sp. JC740]MCC9641788.1 hypothetical protein [Rhodopirellula sp. JC740]
MTAHSTVWSSDRTGGQLPQKVTLRMDALRWFETFQTSLPLQQNSMMSPTPEQIDQLISDHLDGRLTEDQSQWLAEQLRMDADFAQRIRDAELDRKMLRSLHENTTASRALPSDFASRVVAAAHQRAIDEDLSAEHPLRQMKVSIPVEVAVAQSNRYGKRAWIAAVAGLAAAGLLVASLRTQVPGPTPDNPVLDPSTTIAQSDSDPSNPPTGTQPQVVPEPTLADEPASEMIASDDLPATAPEAMIASADLGGESVSPSLQSDDMPTPTTAREIPAADVSSMVANQSSKDLQTLSGAVLIYDVRLTPEARNPGLRNHFASAGDPIRKAMTSAGLEASSKQLVSERLIEATRESVTLDDDTRYQILLLRGPAKQLDRLFLELLSDDESVDSVGMSMAMGNAVSGIAWKQENETVGADAVAYELNADDKESLQQLGVALSNRDFMPVKAESFSNRINFALGSPEAASTGNDFITEVLVIIR